MSDDKYWPSWYTPSAPSVPPEGELGERIAEIIRGYCNPHMQKAGMWERGLAKSIVDALDGEEQRVRRALDYCAGMLAALHGPEPYDSDLPTVVEALEAVQARLEGKEWRP
jgi:hypothetical protein